MKKTDKIEALVKSAPEETEREFLIGMMREDSVMEAAFKRFCPREVTGFDKQYYKEYIDGLIAQYEDGTGFINYSSAYMFFDEVEVLLYDDAEELLGAGKYDEAFELSAYVCYRMESVAADDSDGGLIQVIGHCCDVWRNIACAVRGEEKERFFDKVIAAGERMGDVATDIFDDFIINEFEEKEFLQKKLEFIDKKIEQFKKKTTSHAAYMVEHWLSVKLDIMNADENLTQEQERLYKENWDSPKIKLWYVQKRLDEEKFDEAIAVMKELISVDNAYAYKEKLKEVYKMAGREKGYTDMLVELAQTHGDLEAFYELKEQYYPEDWATIREGIIEQMPKRNLDVVFYSEEMDGKLLEYAVNYDGLFYVDKYKLLLVKKYPEAVLKKYVKEAEKAAMWADKRSKYKALVRLLKTIKSLPGGEDAAKELIERWKCIYNRRTAMIEEMNKLKL